MLANAGEPVSRINPNIPKPPVNIIAPRMKLAREAVGIKGRLSLSQDDLAEKFTADLRLDRTTISKIERLERGVKDYELIAIAEALEVDVRWLLGLSDEGGPQ